MLEFLMDWDVPYLFGLAGSEEVGLLDALVDRPVPFVTCLHENAAMAMAIRGRPVKLQLFLYIQSRVLPMRWDS